MVAKDDGIEHVIVLMLENRSFDQMLGALAEELKLDGVLTTDGKPRTNRDASRRQYKQQSGAARVIRFDPKHELEHVVAQLAGENTGFVDDFARAFPSSSPDDRAEIMKYYETLPALHELARNFVVCDRWFSSVPGPTWPNRFFVHSGTSLGRVAMPNGILDANLHWYDQITVYDRLNERSKPWAVYYGDIPQSLMLANQLEPHNAKNYSKMLNFYRDVGRHPSEPFPSYCFIEPAYYAPSANDDHPTHDVAAGDRLIADVYNAVRANEDLWQKCLLVVLFGEHGGFYDHVVPPKAVPPDHHQQEYSFDQFGLRVPAILVSPRVDRGRVSSREFDHTSLLRYLSDKWSLGPLGARTAGAASFEDAIVSDLRSDCPAALPYWDGLQGSPPMMTNRAELSSHQTALFAMTQLLESMSATEGAALRSRIDRMITGFDGAVDVGIERVEEFLSGIRWNA
ncbi:MAG: alkaline phosphatase family protein [Devosia sp.]|nr:alkaline phosphatase family protein [Devosia sp.]